jgi:hypothetical protein
VKPERELPLIPNIDIKALCFIMLKHDLVRFFTPDHILMQNAGEWNFQSVLRCPGTTP